MIRILSSWFFRIPAALVLVLVALGAAWYFLIREDNEAQKEASAITDQVRQAAGQGTTPAAGQQAQQPRGVAGTYRLVDGQSEAWFLAPEKLASLPTSSVAKGSTKSVKGEFHLTAEGLDPGKATQFTITLADLKSDAGQRDRMVQKTLETSRFPEAKFVAKSLTGAQLSALNATTDTVFQLTGEMEVHGVRKEVTWEVKAKREGNIISALATLKTRYDAWGMSPPNLANFVTVDEDLTLQIQLFATPAG